MKWDQAPVLSADIPAVVAVESGGDDSAVSPKGAKGRMQVLDATNAKPGFGVVPARDDSKGERVRVGEDYLSVLQQKYGREGGLRAYNMGPGAYERWVAAGSDPAKLPVETASYVPKVDKMSPKATWQSAPLVPAESTIPVDTGVAPPPDEPGLLDRAGSVLKQAMTKEGLKTLGKSALNTVADAPWAFATGAGKLYAPVVGAVQDVIGGKKLGTSNTDIQQSLDEFSKETAIAPDSPGYRGVQSIAEIAGTAAPIMKGGQLAAQGISKLPLVRKLLSGGVAAPVIGDIAANAAYGAGRAGVEGKDADSIISAAADAATGAAAGRGIMAAVGGVKATLPTARRLLAERGGLPTFGQIFGGGVESLERAASKFPVTGRITGTREALKTAGESFSTADVNRAIERTGHKVTTTGEKAVQDGVAAVNGNYERLIPQTRLYAVDADNAVNNALSTTLGASAPRNSRKWMEAYQIINEEVGHVTRGVKWTNGRAAKDLDEHLGKLALSYAKGSDPRNAQVGDVIREVQRQLRVALKPIPGAPSSVVNDLQRTNRARAGLYPLEDAAANAARSGGHFGPAESFAARSAGTHGKAPYNDRMNTGARATEALNKSDNIGPQMRLGTELTAAGGASWLGAPTMAAAIGGGNPLALALAGAGLSGVVGMRALNHPNARRFLLEGLAGGLPQGGIRRFLQSQKAGKLGAQAGREANE